MTRANASGRERKSHPEEISYTILLKTKEAPGSGDKPMTGANASGQETKSHPEEISYTILLKMKEVAEAHRPTLAPESRSPTSTRSSRSAWRLSKRHCASR